MAFTFNKIQLRSTLLLVLFALPFANALDLKIANPTAYKIKDYDGRRLNYFGKNMKIYNEVKLEIPDRFLVYRDGEKKLDIFRTLLKWQRSTKKSDGNPITEKIKRKKRIKKTSFFPYTGNDGNFYYFAAQDMYVELRKDNLNLSRSEQTIFSYTHPQTAEKIAENGSDIKSTRAERILQAEKKLKAKRPRYNDDARVNRPRAGGWKDIRKRPPENVQSPYPENSSVCDKIANQHRIMKSRRYLTRKFTQYYTPMRTTYSTKVCKNMEGSCIVMSKAGDQLHNYGKKAQWVKDTKCKHGYGSVPHDCVSWKRNGRGRKYCAKLRISESRINQSTKHLLLEYNKSRTSITNKVCLDPGYNVAAHMTSGGHKFGDVIFIPALRGRKTQDGTRHSGCMMVTDVGSAIKGFGRFDFFLGRCWTRSSVSTCLDWFANLNKGLTKKPFYKVPDDLAVEFVKERKERFRQQYL